jgi:cyclopropane-fatty-acyl-phospholipid synthase
MGLLTTEHGKAWHAEHHRRPRTLIGTRTILGAALIAMLVFLPALVLSDLWRACVLISPATP